MERDEHVGCDRDGHDRRAALGLRLTERCAEMMDTESEEWDSVPADPAPDDLGYDLLELDITESSADGGHYVILPHDEDMLRDEAFIIADTDAVCDLISKV
jgi:hypothetical protein